MTFAEFQEQRKQLLATRPGLVDCAGTNLYAALADLVPGPTPASAEKVHRCHLATEWCERFGLPAEMSKHALISCGVRDSLARLFAHYASQPTAVWLPSDNYPVYWDLARAAGLSPRAFPTLPEPQWPREPRTSGFEILLVTNPLKPLSRRLSPRDAEMLKHWLAASPQRRLLLDTVYTFEANLSPGTLDLFRTDQTIVLHSLTKGWLQPRLFGVALVPQNDAPGLAPVFRANPPPQANLARAREMLASHPTLPMAIGHALSMAWNPVQALLAKHSLSLPKPDAPSYLFSIRVHWRELLDRTRILGLPASTFGSSREDLTILSSLSFLKNPRP